jgi:hypothetical protein
MVYHLTEQKLLLINNKSYRLVSNLSCINNTGGGLCIYVRSDMIQNTVAKKNLSIVFKEKIFEAYAAQIIIEKFLITVVCIHRYPSGDFDHFFNLTFKNHASYIYRTGIPLPSKCCILYIFSTYISNEYFKHAAHSPFFSSKCHWFHNATFFGSCVIHILHTECAKI